MDLEVMPKSYQGHKFFIYIIDELTNYLITSPIHQSRSEEIRDALINDVISTYCIPDHIILNQENVFMLILKNYLLKKFYIRIKTVAPYNHQSLQDECGIKSLSTISTKHLTGLGQV